MHWPCMPGMFTVFADINVGFEGRRLLNMVMFGGIWKVPVRVLWLEIIRCESVFSTEDEGIDSSE